LSKLNRLYQQVYQTTKRKVTLGFLGRFSAPKAKIELKLNEAVYTYTDKLTGLISIDPLEDIALEELRLELAGHLKVKWRKGLNSYNSSSSLGTIKIPFTGPMNLRKEQHFEQPFQAAIPLHARPDPFTETELKAKAVAAVKGRPDITHELTLGITFPYVIECLRNYGGCGFVSPPSSVAVNICPGCGRNLEEQWNKKHNEEANQSMNRAMNKSHGFH
jgi:hypothetical protein